MTNEQHNKFIAYVFFAHAAFQLLMLVFMAAIFSIVFLIPDEPGKPAPPREIFALMIGVMTIFQMVFIAPSAIAGYALLKRRAWARTASIVGGVIAAMNVPIGTAACVYALWFFFSDNWREIYPSESGSLRDERPQLAFGVESQRAAYEAEEREPQPFRAYEPPDWR